MSAALQSMSRAALQALRNEIVWSACLAVQVVGFVGCHPTGPTIIPVSGIVTLDNKPLSEGVVNFVAESGYVSSAPLDSEGGFHLASQWGDGIPAGTYHVTVLPPPRNPSNLSRQSPKPATAGKIPQKYQYADRSGLSAVVNDGGAEFMFELSSITQ